MTIDAVEFDRLAIRLKVQISERWETVHWGSVAAISRSSDVSPINIVTDTGTEWVVPVTAAGGERLAAALFLIGVSGQDDDWMKATADDALEQSIQGALEHDDFETLCISELASRQMLTRIDVSQKLELRRMFFLIAGVFVAVAALILILNALGIG